MKKKNRFLCYALSALAGVCLWGCGENGTEPESDNLPDRIEDPEVNVTPKITFSEDIQRLMTDNHIIINLGYDEQEQVVSFTTNVDWVMQIYSNYGPSKEWLTVSVESESVEVKMEQPNFYIIRGKGSNQAYNIHFRLAENNGKDIREIEFDLSSDIYDISNKDYYYRGSIIQSMQLFENTSISVSYAGRTERPKTKNNIEIREIVSETDWIHVITNSDNLPFYKIDENDTGKERRAKILCKSKTNLATVAGTLTIIQNGIKVEKEINVTTPGTLSDLIPFEEKYKITDLTLTGKLNDDDIRYIREMAGIDYADQDTEGVLANLDIAGVDMISSPKFSDCKLVSIVLPNSTESLAWNAFDNCHSLVSVSMPDRIKSLDYSVFRNCISLSILELPSELTNIRGCFSGCVSLQTLIIPNKVKTIEYRAFQNCTKLTELTLPSSLQTMNGSDIFSGCTNLKKLHCKATEPPLCDNLLGIEETATLYIPKGTLAKYKDAASWRNFKTIIEE